MTSSPMVPRLGVIIGDPGPDTRLSSSVPREVGVAQGWVEEGGVWAVVVPPETRWGDGVGRAVGSGVTPC